MSIPANCIRTVTGKIVDLVNPTYESLDLWDICYALGNICRFNGHTNTPYSVAEHSLIVAALVPQNAKLAALLHDASEAYLGDVATPQKMLPDMAGYRLREAKFQAMIYTKFGVFDSWDSTIHKWVKWADGRLLRAETETFMDSKTPKCSVMQPYAASELLYKTIKEVRAAC